MDNNGLKARVIVLGVGRYQFRDDATGEMIEGAKVHYIEADSSDEKDSFGQIPAVANMPYAYFDEIQTVPGVYDAEMNIKMSGKKPSLKVTAFKYIEPISLVNG